MNYVLNTAILESLIEVYNCGGPSRRRISKLIQNQQIQNQPFQSQITIQAASSIYIKIKSQYASQL